MAQRKSMQKSRAKKSTKARSKMKPTVLLLLHAHQANSDRKWILLDFENVK